MKKLFFFALFLFSACAGPGLSLDRTGMGENFAHEAEMSDEPIGAVSGMLIPTHGLTLFSHGVGPLSYRAMTSGEANKVKVEHLKIEPRVSGEACQKGIYFPIVGYLVKLNFPYSAFELGGSWGNGGFQKAVESLHDNFPGLVHVVDLKVDYNIKSVLTIYLEFCTRVTGVGVFEKVSS